MNLADLLLRFGSLFEGRVEKDEVLIFRFGLRQSVRAAFPVPAIRNGELCLGKILALIVGVDQSVQGDSRDLVTAVLDVANGLVEENLIRLFGVFRDWVLILLAAKSAGTEKAGNERQNQKITIH